MTEYYVLRARKGEDPDTWERLPGTFKGSPRSVCKAAADKTAGLYVAVPIRSWQPLPVNVEQKTVVTVG